MRISQKWTSKQDLKRGLLRLITTVVSSEVDRFEGGSSELREGRVEVECEERQNLLDGIREIMGKYITTLIPSKSGTLPDKDTFPALMHLFTLSFILDDLTSSHLRRSVATPLTLPLFTQLQHTVQHSQ